MIRLSCNVRSVKYSAYHIIRAFLPDAEIDQQGEVQCDEEYLLVRNESKVLVEIHAEKLDKENCDIAVYDSLKDRTGRDLPWGILTGVRPVKLFRERLGRMSGTEITEYLRNRKKVSEKKATVCLDIALREQKLIRKVLNGQDRDIYSYSLYVGIPVCPSICSYCSFSSGPLSRWGERMDDYTDALVRELTLISEKLRSLKLTSVYIGGGTPTVLTTRQMERLMTCLDEHFPMKDIYEYTLEAGRPDTITEEKLKIASDHAVTRLSVNPQSMQQKTLDLVGRGHSVSQIYEAYEMARGMGFDNINMDIIAGLPGEDVSDMEGTLKKIELLKPDNLTVHALAIKRAAGMTKQSAEAVIVDEMIELAAAEAESMGMVPYYLYRQKSIAGNHENIGYAVPGRECIYNVMIMEEIQSIAACGAGSTSKVLLKEKIQNPDRAKGVMTYLLRQDDVSNIGEYIDRAEEMAFYKEKTFDNIISPCYYT